MQSSANNKSITFYIKIGSQNQQNRSVYNREKLFSKLIFKIDK